MRALQHLPVGPSLWESCFLVAPLVVVGTKERGGEFDLAPKHMVAPLSWEDHFGFVCTPSHATYGNVRREGVFTVSFPRPDQVLLTSLAAAPRAHDASKPSLAGVPTFAAPTVDGVLVEGAYLFLECELDRIVDGFARNSLIVGRIVAAHADPEAVRDADVDDQDLLMRSPLLAYVHPGRWARIDVTFSFPYHEGFAR
jgi:flavin reductase (DIM6/NTAB) family NADH-FMN oxidoreductase RutF